MQKRASCSIGFRSLPRKSVIKIFSDPFNTAGLLIDPGLHDGFPFTVLDAIDNMTVQLECASEMYDLLALIGTPGR